MVFLGAELAAIRISLLHEKGEACRLKLRTHVGKGTKLSLAGNQFKIIILFDEKNSALQIKEKKKKSFQIYFLYHLKMSAG